MAAGGHRARRVDRTVKLLALVMLVAVALGFAAVAAELWLRRSRPTFIRASDVPGLPYEMTPNSVGRYRGTEYRINELGVRGDRVPVPKPPGERRILFLGDSIVLGGHVPEEAGVAARLESRWHAVPGHVGTRVVNAGVSSYHLAHYLVQYERLAPVVEPDVVLIGLFLNDHFPYLAPDQRRALERTPALWEKSDLLRAAAGGIEALRAWLFGPSRLAPRERAEIATAIPDPGSVESLLAYFDRMRYPTALLKREQLLTAFDLAAWDRIRAPLETLHQRVRARHGSLIVVIFPVAFQLEDDFRYPEPQARIQQICDALQVPVLDTVPVLRALQRRLGRSAYPFRGDLIHFGVEAHDAVAEAIVTLQRRLEAPPR